MQETSPKRVQNILPSQESEPLPRITKRKTDLVSPDSWQRLAEPHLQKDCNPHPCPATSWGPQPEGYQAEFSGHKRRQESNSCPERERLEQPVGTPK